MGTMRGIFSLIYPDSEVFYKACIVPFRFHSVTIKRLVVTHEGVNRTANSAVFYMSISGC